MTHARRLVEKVATSSGDPSRSRRNNIVLPNPLRGGRQWKGRALRPSSQTQGLVLRKTFPREKRRPVACHCPPVDTGTRNQSLEEMEVLANTVFSQEPCKRLRDPGLEEGGHPQSANFGNAGTRMRATWPNHFQQALRMVKSIFSHSAASKIILSETCSACPSRKPTAMHKPAFS